MPIFRRPGHVLGPVIQQVGPMDQLTHVQVQETSSVPLFESSWVHRIFIAWFVGVAIAGSWVVSYVAAKNAGILARVAEVTLAATMPR